MGQVDEGIENVRLAIIENNCQYVIEICRFILFFISLRILKFFKKLAAKKVKNN